jgi:acyl transferase domain-containing protein/NADPH:quinone reductase-like Zn-dependent oxidoreductase
MAEKPNPTGTASEHSALLKQALRAVEQMRQKVDAAESRMHQPIAIVGMGCRFPGDANDADSFWELLQNGREAIGEVPADRWKIDDYYDPDATVPGKMVTRFGGFLRNVDRFDAAFFGIAPREAAMMDPQQRLLLEVVWQALESGGIAPKTLAGSKTGMYLGIASGDYAQLQLHAGDAEMLDVHYASGNAHSIASGRLSYLLGLKGPSLSVDTACSSSLVAVHLACQALRSGECTLAIAGGVNVILAPETTVALSQAHMLAPDGRSKTFDDRADGFARAEGCGVVVLKPQAQAEKDGDCILAVIRGTALNQDGASSSLTAPNGPSQEELMRAALANAGLGAEQVGYVEAHGTGTALGDPIELRALGAVYGAAHSPERPLLVGSLKTNFGHMEAAAGIGGLIKLVLALQQGEIPEHLQLKTPTTHVNWQELRLAVPRTTIPWPVLGSGNSKRVGAVSSFGFSGTNAHLVVEQAPVNAALAPEKEVACLLAMSAQSELALRESVASYVSWLRGASSQQSSWAEIAATAGIGRDHFRHRAAVVASSKDEAADALGQLLLRSEPGNAAAASSLCFLFTGQGSERTGMGLELLERSVVFRSAVERLDTALVGSGLPRLATIWASENGEQERASLVQPALYAYGWALSELWRSWGVEPQVVLGHSLGEYVAATVAGVMTPEEGIRLVAGRGRLTEELAHPGGMVAVAASREAVEGLMRRTTGLSVAAVNGPDSVVVSGGMAAIEGFEEQLRSVGLRYKRLRATHGFHSAALEPMLDAFETEAARVAFRIPELRWISNLTGRAVERKQPVNAAYWRRHLRETVDFRAGLEAAQSAGSEVFVEIGAEPQLLALAEANGLEENRRVASVAKGGMGGEWQKLLSAAGRLYEQGVALDWKGLNGGALLRRVPLPGYPFQRQRYWFDMAGRPERRSADATRKPGMISGSGSGHPLLGTRLRTRSESVTFQALLSPDQPAHLGDHVVLGRRILPGAAYLEMATAAAACVEAGKSWAAADVELREACVFDEPRLLETVIYPSEAEAGRRRFEIASTSTDPESAWTLHSVGWLVAGEPTKNDATFDFSAVQDRAEQVWNGAEFYERFLAAGLAFGPALRPVVQAWGAGDEGLVAIELAPEVAAESRLYVLHPIALDACLQSAAAFGAKEANDSPALPAAVGSYRLLGDPARLRFAHARVIRRQGRGLTVEVRGLDADGRCLLVLESLTLVQAAQEPYAGWLHEVVWERAALPAPPHGWMEASDWRGELLQAGEVNGLAGFDRWMGEFDDLCAAWVAECFEQGGFMAGPGRKFALAELIQVLRVVPEHHRLALRLCAILVESGYLRMDGDGFVALGKARLDSVALLTRLRLAGHPELEWTARTAPLLLPLLRGELSAVDALFADGGHAIATRLYRESVVARTFHAALVIAAQRAIAALGGNARVLEVGGGTGATTSYLVPALDGSFAEYVWTDIGAGFVSAARREFADVPKMRFQTLDLERDPTAQGWNGELFDVVVASNVIHATADLRKTLAHVHSLLRPGGTLLMMETVGKRQPWVDLTVGFTEGWWRFTDHDLRPDYPLLSRAAWAKLLSESGFGEVSVAPEEDGNGGTFSRQCVIAAVALAEVARLMIVTSGLEPSPLALELQFLGTEAGAAVTLVSSAGASWAKVQQWLGGTASGVKANLIYLPGYETPALSSDHTGLEAMAWQETVLGGALAWTQALLAADRQGDCRVWLVSRGAVGPEMTAPEGATLAAFAHSLRAEYEEAEAIAVDLSGGTADAGRLWSLCQGTTHEMQYALRGEEVWVPRLMARPPGKGQQRKSKEAEPGEMQTRRLRFSGTGLLEDLRPQIEARREPGKGEVEIAIHAAAINFHEVLSALSADAHDAEHDLAPGGECSGIVTRVGDEVCDLQAGDEVVATGWGLMADFATLSGDRVWKRPAGLRADDAATLLIPFLTARWSLETVAQLQPGERVLIHAGAGGVGLAAIEEARRLGAVVYATAGSEAKRQYLLGLGVAAVFDSRSTEFEQGVLAATGFLGVDVVLNSLSGDKIAAGLRTLASGGRFIELGEQTALTDREAAAIRPDVGYHRVHLRAALLAAAPEVRAVIQTILADVETGLLKPLPWKRFGLEDAAEAFRYMAAGQQTGRVLLAAGVEDAGFPGVRRDGAYVVTGAFSGLGLLVVEWLAEQGAGCVLALGRSGPDAEAQLLFSRLKHQGTVVVQLRCEVSDEQAIGAALGKVPAGFQLRGIFHSAGALDDAGLSQQSWDRFRTVLAGKIAGAWNLHRLTRSAALDCFVLFSSSAGVFGARGQANHAAANAYLDALAHFRKRLGLAALSINWGAWSGVGAAVRHGVVERSVSTGVTPIDPANGLRMLERLLHEDCTQVLVSKVDWRKWVQSYAAGANVDLLTQVLQAGASSPRPATSAAPKAVKAADLASSWRETLLAAPEPRRRPMLEARVEERVRAVLSMAGDYPIDRLRPLQEYGLDSLLSIELRNALSADLETRLSATALFDYPTLASLTDWLFQDVLKLIGKNHELPSTTQSNGHDPSLEPSQTVLDGLTSLSDDEVDRLFQQKMAGMRR